MSTLASAGVVTPPLPAWADELRRRYLRGESSQFVIHGNVHDELLYDGKLYTLSEFLAQVLLERSKDTIIQYNVSMGVRFAKRKLKLDGLEELVLQKEPAKVLPLLERALTTEDKLAVILEYSDTIAPAGDTSFSTTDDRAAAVTLHRWSLLRALEQADSVVILTLENLSELHPKIVSNPRVATVRVPMPSTEERTALLRFLDPGLDEANVARLAEVTAGLKSIHIKAILSTPESAGDTAAERTRAPVASQTQQLSQQLSIDRLVAARKREIIERECFGLIEFVTPNNGFDVVGGMDEVKKDLLLVAKNIREGKRNRVPMGILFTGPMGTGKTFVAEAFAKECGLTTIKLKNFRSKWVGATEGNLERILSVIQAIGQIIVIIDEGDRAFGGSDGDGDGGTSSRVIGRIKEFMSDTDNRGRVLFILMTNRPDKLDVDIKRAGRLDRKIPFLYPQTGDEVINILKAQFKKNKIKSELDFDAEKAAAEAIVGYSNADIEAIVMLANDYSGDNPVRHDDLARATKDYLPSRDVQMLEYMELLAVFEASNRRMLPKKYADVPIDELQARLQLLKAQVGSRR